MFPLRNALIIVAIAVPLSLLLSGDSMRPLFSTVLLRTGFLVQSPHLSARHYYTTSSSSSSTSSKTMDPRINELLDFWFSLKPEQWFRDASPELDAHCRARFMDLAREARTPSLDAEWTATPRGTLALILLLDQIPRNVFRGSADSFASDPKALAVATAGIAREFDVAVAAAADNGTLHHRMFYYLPFCHAEDLLAQVAGVALVDRFVAEQQAASSSSAGVEKTLADSPAFYRRHRDCVARWGRFPKRNAWLGRETTPEEAKFLEENPVGF